MENNDDKINSANFTPVTPGTSVSTESTSTPETEDDRDLLSSFVRFCAKRPELPFWQALRIWADVDSLYAGSGSAGDGGFRVLDDSGMALYLRDTYNFNNRRN